MGRIIPTLHPKSRFTSSLFATTLFASFFVVVIPHILPCPAPRVAYTDDGSCPPGKRRRRKIIVEDEPNLGMSKRPVPEPNTTNIPAAQSPYKSLDGLNVMEGNPGVRRSQRECPIPKPGGLVGEILGFRKVTVGEESSSSDETALSGTIASKARTMIVDNKGGTPP